MKTFQAVANKINEADREVDICLRGVATNISGTWAAGDIWQRPVLATDIETITRLSEGYRYLDVLDPDSGDLIIGIDWHNQIVRPSNI